MALSTELRPAVVMTPTPIRGWVGHSGRQSHVRKGLDGLQITWEELRRPGDLVSRRGRGRSPETTIGAGVP